MEFFVMSSADQGEIVSQECLVGSDGFATLSLRAAAANAKEGRQGDAGSMLQLGCTATEAEDDDDDDGAEAMCAQKALFAMAALVVFALF